MRCAHANFHSFSHSREQKELGIAHGTQENKFKRNYIQQIVTK